jgi:hypothetical protein
VSTKALHLKPKVFFTSSPNSGSLACEDAPFHSACEGVSFRCRSIALVKLPPVGGRMCSCLKRTLRCLKYKNWLLLLSKTNYIVPAEYDRLESLCRELRITLIASINTAKDNIK